MLTCYDFSFARILSRCAIDMLLVGDSLANVVLGMERINDISFEEMLAHTRAVKKGAPQTLVVADMPYVCCQKNTRKAVYYARRFVAEGGADAVKIEWFEDCLKVCRRLIKAGIPVMGHIGLTPQSADKIGGFKVQGKDSQAAARLLDQAALFEREKVFSLVLECIPRALARLITGQVKVPTIGIGSGSFCDGQVLVLYDLLGLYRENRPKFVKLYADLQTVIDKAVNKFGEEIQGGIFPGEKESYSISAEELKKIKNLLNEK